VVITSHSKLVLQFPAEYSSIVCEDRCHDAYVIVFSRAQTVQLAATSMAIIAIKSDTVKRNRECFMCTKQLPNTPMYSCEDLTTASSKCCQLSLVTISGQLQWADMHIAMKQTVFYDKAGPRPVNGRFAPGCIKRFQLIQLKPKHHRLDVFNYSCRSVRMSWWIKELSTYLLNMGRNVLEAKRPGANWQRGETSINNQ